MNECSIYLFDSLTSYKIQLFGGFFFVFVFPNENGKEWTAYFVKAKLAYGPLYQA